MTLSTSRFSWNKEGRNKRVAGSGLSQTSQHILRNNKKSGLTYKLPSGSITCFCSVCFSTMRLLGFLIPDVVNSTSVSVYSNKPCAPKWQSNFTCDFNEALLIKYWQHMPYQSLFGLKALSSVEHSRMLLVLSHGDVIISESEVGCVI